MLARADALGMRAEIVTGSHFRHVILRPARAPGSTLHVYVDHDGTPWLGNEAAADPTPRNDLTLRLMALDTQPSAYLGRPCYVGLATEPGCSPALWTSGRYSEAVVDSMAAGLRRLLVMSGASRAIVFGYSGGGTLAMLLSARVPETVAVITVGANLDIDAWAAGHGWPRLTDSLNPARLPPAPGVYRRHYVGERDTTVAPDLVRRSAPVGDAVVVVADYDHVCCWETLWPRVLHDVDAAVSP